MLTHLKLDNILFLDIETAPLKFEFKELDEKGQELWAQKTRWIQQREDLSPEEVYDRAGIFAEFSQVICASVGFFSGEGDKRTFRLKSVYGADEKKLLGELRTLFDRFFKDGDALLCAHNGKEFDFPFLARRFIINQIELPSVLDLAGKKPWEVQHLDTMNLWKFGDYKHYTSVDLLAYSLGIPSPKDDISGADVARVYHEEGDIERIKNYCEKDVITIARILLRFKGERDMKEDEVLTLTESRGHEV